MQRSLMLFKNSTKSEETYKTYKYILDKFIEFYKLKDYDSVAKMDKKMLQEMVEDYTMDIKTGNAQIFHR